MVTLELEYKNDGEVNDLEELVETMQSRKEVDYWYIVQLANKYADAKFRDIHQKNLEEERRGYKEEISRLNRALDAAAKREYVLNEKARKD